MSGIAGIVHLDGSPIDAGVLQRMTDAAAHRGPDGAGTWADGPAGLGHRMFRTTPEALQERQPLCDESGQVCLVLDGRVDNREDLAKALEAKGVTLRDCTDAELVLKCYLQWGEDAPRRILGDFAFAIWDGRQRALFCARDVFGIRPFNYYCGGNFVLIASELHQLFHDPRVKRVPNEGMVAEYLSGQITHCEETLWEGILRLPAAHYMWVRPGGIEKRRYWDFDLSKEIRYKTDEEYASQFFHLFREAVRCRLRSCGPIGSYLSGGLDSSSVSVIANELLREQGRTEPLDTFSLVFPGMSCDESEYIQATVEHAGLRSHRFPPVPPSMEYYDEQARRYQDFPGWPNGGAMMALPLQEGLRQAGTVVMLTGWGGNECVEGSSTRFEELAREGHLLELLRTAKAEAALWGTPWWRLVLDYGVRPNIPCAVKRVLRPLRPRRQRFGWLPAEFQRRTALLSRVRASSTPPGANRFQQAMYSYFYSGRSAHFHECWDRDAAFLGIDHRHPFFDRRLAEFAFALPERQRSHRGLVKVVLRNALQGRLPEPVIRRRFQPDFGPVFTRELCALDGQDPFSGAATAERGWTLPFELCSWLRKARAGDSDDLWRLWAAIGIEIWLHQIRGNPCFADCFRYGLGVQSLE
jgi:asparagine synthase (glutamine-hydrolysing)